MSMSMIRSSRLGGSGSQEIEKAGSQGRDEAGLERHVIRYPRRQNAPETPQRAVIGARSQQGSQIQAHST
jgi:hypothetical protein